VRGYDNDWRKIRQEVLISHGIPREEWAHYDIDHFPAYDKEKDPNHRHYVLTPMLHRDHSTKTARHDGGYGNNRRGGGSNLYGKKL
jgi:hypothetical protein